MLTDEQGRVKYIMDMTGKSGHVSEHNLSTNRILPDYPATPAMQLAFFSQVQ
jgi:hypothetical protein